MVKGKIYVAGIGPGCETDITPAVMETLRKCNVVVGYKYYFRYILIPMPLRRFMKSSAAVP